MAFSATKQQQQAICSKGSVLVSAAAGSGKTAVLVERVIKKLCDESSGVTADRLLIVTFTNSAASEMRTRIERRMAKEIFNNPRNGHLKKQQMLLGCAKICTIDSFCIDLVKEYFEQLSVSPDFKILDPSRAKIIKIDLLSDILLGEYSKADSDFLDLLECFGGYISENDVIETLLKVYEFSRCMPFSKQWLERTKKMYTKPEVWYEILFRHVEEAVNSASGELVALIADATYCATPAALETASVMLATSECLNAISVAASQNDFDGVMAAVKSYNFGDISRKKDESFALLRKHISEVKASLKKRIEKLESLFSREKKTANELLEFSRKNTDKLVDIVLHFSNAFEEDMRLRSAFTFDEVEHLALQLLCDEKDGEIVPSVMAKQISSQYSEVLVDEYQDTNDLQDALFFALSNNGERLFIVGDVKQSIYGFRHANPDNFLKLKNEYTDYDGVSTPSKITLDANFRSRADICSFINYFFGLLMNIETSGIDYAKDAYLTPMAVYPDNNEYASEIHIVNFDKDEERVITQARYIAKYINSVMKKSAFLRDEVDPTVLRQARFGDFAILMRSDGDKFSLIKDELHKYGIPAASNSSDYIKTSEIQLILSLLKVINNPTEDVALLGVMMSPIFGFSGEDIAVIRALHKNINLYSAMVLSARDGNVNAEIFVSTISKLRLLSVTKSISELLLEAYTMLAIPEIMSAARDGGRKKNNIIRFVSVAEEYDGSERGGLSDFTRYMDRLSAGGNIVGSHGVGENVVRIMTMHKSKGLQFKICIIAGISGDFNKMDQRSPIIVNAECGISTKAVCRKRLINTSTVARDATIIKTERKMISEELRLFYVAMTRAEEKLVFILCEKNLEKRCAPLAISRSINIEHGKTDAAILNSAKGFSDWLLYAAMQHKLGRDLCEAVSIEHYVNLNSAGGLKIILENSFDTNMIETVESTEVIETNMELAQAFEEKFEYKYPHNAATLAMSKGSITEIFEKETKISAAFKTRPSFLGKGGLSPAERGIAMHSFMQFANFELASSNVKTELERLVEWEFLTPDQARSIDLGALDNFFKSDLYRRIKNADFVKREQRFITEIPAKDELGAIINDEFTMVQGIADCVFGEDGKLVIVDFKTDNVTDLVTLRDRYTAQLNAYSDALSNIYRMPVKTKIIFSLRLNKEVII